MLFYRMLHRLDVHFAVEERRRIAATVTIARRKLHRPKKYYVSTPTTESYGTRYIYKKVWKNPVCVLLLAKFLGTFGKSFPERGTLGKKFKNPFISVQNWRRTKLTPFWAALDELHPINWFPHKPPGFFTVYATESNAHKIYSSVFSISWAMVLDVFENDRKPFNRSGTHIQRRNSHFSFEFGEIFQVKR